MRCIYVLATNCISTETAINSQKETSDRLWWELSANQLLEEELATVMDLQ